MDKPKKVELKSTVAAGDAERALEALGLSFDDGSATTSLVVFCEDVAPDGSLALSRHGLIVRLRWRLRLGTGDAGDATNDCTVKVRPVTGDPARWSPSRRPGEKDKLEGDWTPSVKVNSFSRRIEKIPNDTMASALNGSIRIVDVFGSGQLALLESVLDAEVPTGLRCCPPVMATAWDLPSGRQAEWWTVAGLHFLEISERVDHPMTHGANPWGPHLAFVRGLGVEPSFGWTKTDRVLSSLLRPGGYRAASS